MRRLFAFLLLGVTLAALALAVGLGWMFYAFNPNDYKEQIGAAVARATGRQVVFHDDIAARFLPRFGMETGRISLVEPGMYGGEPFLSVDNAFVSIVPESLLHKVIVVDAIILNGARLNLITAADGSRNWEYGFDADPAALAVPVVDAASPADPARNAGTGQTGTGQAGTSMAGAGLWKVYLQGARVQCSDALVAYTDALGIRQWEMELERVDAAGSDKGVGTDISLTGQFKDASSGDKASFSLDAEARMAGKGIVAAVIRSLHVQLEGVGDLPLSLDSSCSLTYDWNIGLVELEGLSGLLYASGHAGGEASADAAFRSDYTGRLSIILPHGEKQATIRGNLLAGRLNLDTLLHGLDPTVQFVETDIREIRGAPNFTRPKVNRLRGGVASGAMMGPQKLGPVKPAAAPAREPSAQAGPGWYDSMLSGLTLDLDLKADEVTLRRVTLRGLTAKVHSLEKQATVPYSFGLFGGSIDGTCTADFADSIPRFSLISTIKGMRMGELSSAMDAGFSLGGIGIGSLELIGNGKSLNEILHSLKGNASLEVLHGEIRGFKLIPKDLPNILEAPEEFLFTRFSASAQVVDGSATCSDILLESARVSGQGGGVIHLPFGQLDIGMNFMIAGRPPAIPVGISGPYGSLATVVDMETFKRNAEQRQPSYQRGGRRGGIVMDEDGNLYPL